MTYTLHHGDCLKVLPTLPAQSVDAIIADPPYGTTTCKWDSVIPLAPMWAELKRVIKPRGAIVLFAAQPFTSALVMSNAEWFKYEWIWRKNRPTGFVHAKNKPMRVHENVLVFSDGTTVHEGQSQSRMFYFPQMENGKPYTKRVTQTNTGMMNHAPSKANHAFVGTICVNDGTRYPTTVVDFSLHNVGLSHPTQKPVDLLRYLIRTYTNEGDTVLDFTMGSGTTGVAAMKERRKFVGIELDAGYFDIAKRRIGEAVADVTFGLFAQAAD